MCAQKRVPIYFSRDGDKEAKRRIEERQRDTEEKKWKARGERYTMYIRNRGYDSTLVYFSVRFFLSSFRSLFPLLLCSPRDRRGDRSGDGTKISLTKSHHARFVNAQSKNYENMETWKRRRYIPIARRILSFSHTTCLFSFEI